MVRCIEKSLTTQTIVGGGLQQIQKHDEHRKDADNSSYIPSGVVFREDDNLVALLLEREAGVALARA